MKKSKGYQREKIKLKPDLRPIEARALKSVLDTLRFQLQQARVLDCFAGTGRLGIGALQEGAQSVDFIEQDGQTAFELKALLKKNRLEAEVHTADALEYLKGNSKKYDIVFADPPFRLWEKLSFVEELTQVLIQSVQPQGILLVRYPKRVVAFGPLEGFSLWKSPVIADSILGYWIHE